MTIRLWFLPGLACVALALSACGTTPLVTRESTTMTKTEIAAAGLICRKDKAPDTNIPRSICASREAWAAFDERRRQETADLIAEGKKLSNVGRFNRD